MKCTVQKLDDKLQTKMLAAKHNVAVPELIHVVKTPHEVESAYEKLRELDQFVVKPANGSGGKGILVIIVKIEIGLAQNGILLNYLIKHVDIQGKAFCTFKLLDQLATNGASDTILVV